LDISQTFSSVSFGEIGFDINTVVAILDAFHIPLKIVIANGSIGIEAMILWIPLDGLSVVLDSLLIIFVLKGFVTGFFPVLCRFFYLHLK